MQYLLLLHAEEAGFMRMSPEQQQQGMAAYTAYTEALNKAGALKGSNRLQPVSTATTVRVVDGKTQVLDGPYADSKEQLGGYYLIDAPDLDQQVEQGREQLRQAEAQLTQQQAQLDLNRVTWERWRTLVAKGVFSPSPDRAVGLERQTKTS